MGVLASIAFPIVLFAPVSGNIKELYKPCDYSGDFDSDATYRDPSDSSQFSYYSKSFRNLFTRPSVVTVTIAFGNYTFSQAKWLDLAWDIVVGRLGQITLGYISYIVITRYMVFTMESTAIPHRLFMDISFLGPSSMTTIWRVATVTPKSHLWKACKGRLIVLAFNMAYLIAFPTLVSAMTGYVTTFSTRIALGNTTIDYYVNSLVKVNYNIGNCSILDWSGPCHIMESGGGYEVVETRKRYDDNLLGRIEFALSCQTKHSETENCHTFQVQERDVFVDPVGSLNISTINDTYAYDGKVYDEDYIREHGQCQPGKEYHWGFSYQLLFIFSVLNLFWTVSLWAMWVSARGEYGIRTSYGMYRAALDLVAAIKGTLGEGVECMTNAEIEKRLEKRRTGIVVLNEYPWRLVRGWDWTEFYRYKRKWAFKAWVDNFKRTVEEFWKYWAELEGSANRRLN